MYGFGKRPELEAIGGVIKLNQGPRVDLSRQSMNEERGRDLGALENVLHAGQILGERIGRDADILDEGQWPRAAREVLQPGHSRGADSTDPCDAFR
jgi:hypothetical protein